MYIQGLFGSQRALKTVEDFTEFERRAAYFDGDTVIVMKKEANILDRGGQVHSMAECEEILDFPPAPKLGVDGKLDSKKGSAGEMREQHYFLARRGARNAVKLHIYTDNLTHNLQAERFCKPQMINGIMASADGPIKTFYVESKTLRPTFTTGALLPLEDTGEYFNVITEVPAYRNGTGRPRRLPAGVIETFRSVLYQLRYSAKGTLV
jgi:hypothetical protein